MGSALENVTKRNYVILLTTNSLIFKNVNVNGQLLLWKNLRILNESKLNLVDPDYYRTPLNYLKFLGVNYFKRNKKTVKGISVWVIDEWAHNYYHWLVEALTKVISTRLPFEQVTILLPSSYKKHKFHEDSLRLLNIGFEYFDSTYERVECETLYLPLNVAINGTSNPVYIKKLRSLLLNNLKISSASGRNIYVSRRLASKRRLENEAEVFDVLRSYDFTIVDFEVESFEDQMRICASAKVLIGLHGAGLTNMMFMAPGSKVIELRRANEDNFCFNNLADAIGIEYFFVETENLGTDPYDADFRINIGRLEDKLSIVLSG